jgi:hypothetical protein
VSGAPSALAPLSPAAGTLAWPPEGASVVMTGISDAEPMPELMLPSGESR